MRKRIWIVPAGGGLGLVCAGAAQALGGAGIWRAASRPALAFGAWLRELSLSGVWGDVAAWAAVLALSALPLLAWWMLGRAYRGAEDWVLGLMAPVLFGSLYLLVNPTYLSWPGQEFLPMAAAGTLLSMAVAWLSLKLLRGLDGAAQDRLARALGALLTGGAALMAFSAVGGQTAAVAEQWRAVTTGNTAPEPLTLGVLVCLGALRAAPGLLAGATLLWGAELAAALGGPAFDREGVALCERTAVACRAVAQATVVLTVCANLFQLALLDRLLTTNIYVSLPLASLLSSVGLFLLCRCLQRGRALQEDSDSII